MVQWGHSPERFMPRHLRLLLSILMMAVTLVSAGASVSLLLFISDSHAQSSRSGT